MTSAGKVPMSRRVVVPGAILAFLSLTAPLAAQEMWLGPLEGGSIALELVRPSMKNLPMQQSLLSAAFFLTGRVPIANHATLVVELPMANGSFAMSSLGVYFAESGTALGNPYIGFEGRQDSGSTFVEVGVRPPLVSLDAKYYARLIGLASDLDRMDAFLPNVLSASAFLNYRTATRVGFHSRLRVGPLMLVGTKPGFGEPVVYGVYAFQAGYVSRSFEVFGGLTGRALLTQTVDNRFTDQLVVSAHLNLGVLEPGISVRLPIDQGRSDIAGSAIGVSLRISVK